VGGIKTEQIKSTPTQEWKSKKMDYTARIFPEDEIRTYSYSLLFPDTFLSLEAIFYMAKAKRGPHGG